MKKIVINNLDLEYSIDTYGMFKGDSVDESESEYYAEQYQLTEDEWRSVSFNYEHKDIVKSLAIESVSNLHNGLVGIVVLDISKPIKTGSPKFYNYTTDWYIAEWTIDEVQLKKYILNRFNSYRDWVLQSSWSAESRREDQEIELLAMLEYYALNTYTVDDYNQAMWEQESEIYYNHMSLDEESQKLIESKEELK